jgi:hypothetical protein
VCLSTGCVSSRLFSQTLKLFLFSVLVLFFSFPGKFSNPFAVSIYASISSQPPTFSFTDSGKIPLDNNNGNRV